MRPLAMIPREHHGRTVLRLLGDFPVVAVLGARQVGMATLAQRVMGIHNGPAERFDLEDPTDLARLDDARHALAGFRGMVVLDGIQDTPEMLNYVRAVIDRAPAKKGRWLLAGSQEAPLMRGVTESMAGRAAVFQLLPLPAAENARVSLLRGGFPQVVSRTAAARTRFRSYVQTYPEQDVRAVSSIRDLATSADS